MSTKTTDRTWAEISLGNIKFNYNSLKAQLRPDVKLLGVVKADAYGHGGVQVAKTLEELHCEYMAVATVNEAIELREGGIKAPILVLGYSPASYSEAIIENNITQSVSDYQTAKAMSDVALAMGKKITVHLKADTGMGRLGFICRPGCSVPEDMLKIMSLPGLDVEGIFTHFAVSEVYGSEYTNEQFDAFVSAADVLEQKSGKKFRIRHCSNSGGVCGHKEMQLDMVRPGIMLYGLYPGDDERIPLRPAMELKSRIVQIKPAKPGWTVSYGQKYLAEGERKIAVVPIGYADGLHRCLSGKIDMLVDGRRAKQVGNICMDMCMIDVTDIEGAKPGDVVTVFGEDGDGKISAGELAQKAGTIHYEILCAVSKRVPRIYVK